MFSDITIRSKVANYLILWKSHFYSIKTDKWVLQFRFFALQLYTFSSNEVMAKQYEALLTYKINRCDHRRPTTISNNSKVIALFSFYLLIRFVFCPRHVYFRPSWIWYIKRSSSIKHNILMFYVPCILIWLTYLLYQCLIITFQWNIIIDWPSITKS